jgi:hypothetical protein
MENYEWIKGYEGHYKINREGNIWSEKSQKILTWVMNNYGYLRLNLSKNGKPKNIYIHRILALQYITNPDPINLDTADHIDQNPLNNSLENIRWVSKSQNASNSKRHIDNNLGYKHISQNKVHYFIRVRCNGVAIIDNSYFKKNYTLNDVVGIRNNLYIEKGIQQYD